MDDDFLIARQILPIAEEGGVLPAVPIAGVYILAYINEDGEVSAKWHLEGDPDFHQILGMVEMFKMRIVAQAYDWDGEN